MFPHIENFVRTLEQLTADFANKMWQTLTGRMVGSTAMYRLCRVIRRNHTRHAVNIQNYHTQFIRMPALLATFAELVRGYPRGEDVKIASLGWNIGAELYSALYLLRTARPDLRIACYAIDVSESAPSEAPNGVYSMEAPANGAGLYLSGRPALLDCDLATVESTLDRHSTSSICIRDWLRDNITWLASDTTNVDLVHQIGIQDIVITNDFIGSMDDDVAESCLRNVARLVSPGGILVLDEVDSDVKTRVLEPLHFIPVINRLSPIRRSDALKEAAATCEMEVREEAARPEPAVWRHTDSVFVRCPECRDEPRVGEAGSSLSNKFGLNAPRQRRRTTSSLQSRSPRAFSPRSSGAVRHCEAAESPIGNLQMHAAGGVNQCDL